MVSTWSNLYQSLLVNLDMPHLSSLDPDQMTSDERKKSAPFYEQSFSSREDTHLPITVQYLFEIVFFCSPMYSICYEMICL